MPRTQNVAVENNFKGGFITEATGLNFPPDSCQAADNVVFTENGEVKRRLGFGYEANYTTSTITTAGLAISGYTWYNVGNDGQTSYRVEQIGDTLPFWLATSGLAVSASKNATTIDLSSYAHGSNLIEDNPCQFTSTNKYLIVTHPYMTPLVITYAPDTDTFSPGTIDLRIRDFDGVDDTYDIDERVTTTVGSMSTAYKYNLFNQGWYFNSNAALTAWDTGRSDLPSSSDVWWYYKDSSDAFDVSTVAKYDPGFTPAPKGHYTLNVFLEDRDAASGLSGIADVTTGDSRTGTCAFFAGRVWYSGLNYAGYSNNIYFSQVVEDIDQIGMCYQKNDPTSEIASALGPADGGVIRIFEAETVIRMVPLQGALLVFCTNGVWSITGSDAVGFTASDYTVSRITTIPALSPFSLITVENQPIWWNEEGIYVLTVNEQGNLDAKSLSDSAIRTFFLEIPTRNKLFAKAAYDASRKEIKWVYRTASSSDQTTDFCYDSVLTLNLLTGAFSKWSVDIDTVCLRGIFALSTQGGPQTFNQVESNGGADTVLDDNSDNVVVSSLSSTVVAPVFKYLVSEGTNVTFAEANNDSYRDWYEVDNAGVDFDSTFTTGYRVDAQAIAYFQSNYVFVYMKEETDASCFMQGKFDWTTAASEGKWSTAQQIYGTKTNRALRHRRLKVRGKGKAMQLHFYSETGKPFTIVGWAIWETANQGV